MMRFATVNQENRRDGYPEFQLDLDGSGESRIDTGVGFLWTIC